MDNKDLQKILAISTFNLETPLFNYINGKEPYVFKDIWGPYLDKKWRKNK